MRSRKSNLDDGPIQRQIVLVRLVHEMENRPVFGSQFNNDPDGEVRIWIARVGALMARVGIVEGVKFRTEVGMLRRNWENAVRSMLLSVMDTIEELKLEFDLYPEDSLGEVYKEGDVYRFFSDLTKIIASAERDVLIVDPYFDAPTFGQVISSTQDAHVRVLCGRYAKEVSECASKFVSESGTQASVRKSKALHDRLVFIDSKLCWIFGSSLKDGGKKPTYLIPAAPEITAQSIKIYDDIWSNSVAPT